MKLKVKPLIVPINLNKPHLWNDDIARSVDMYNNWFLDFAPTAFRETRIETTIAVEDTLKKTQNLTDISPIMLKEHPATLSSLRMCTCPPIAVDRLIGLAGVSQTLVRSMERGRLPTRMDKATLDEELESIGNVIERLADPDIFVWLARGDKPTDQEIYRAATIVADRLCGSIANPIIRNEQEKRQLGKIETWLRVRGYDELSDRSGATINNLQPGTFSFHLNVPVAHENSKRRVNIPVDAVISPKSGNVGDFPILIEAKSAGDYTNVNKRRKEEATKIRQLQNTYGTGNVTFVLFLCGYFDSGYLGYEAAAGIDWVWEHRIDDLAELGL